MTALLRKLLPLFTADRSRGLGLLCLMLLGAVFEALGIATILPFIALMNDASAVQHYGILRWLYRLSGLDSIRAFLIWLAIGLILVYLLKAAYLTYLSYLQHSFVVRRQVAVSRQLLAGYLASPYTFHLRRNSAELQRILNSDVLLVFNQVVIPVFRMLIELMVVAAITTMLLIVAPLPALLAMLLAGSTSLLFYSLSRKRLSALGKAQTSRFGEMIQWVNHALGSIKEMKVLGRERYFVDSFSQTGAEYARAARFFGVVSDVPRLSIETLTVVGILATMVLMLLRLNDLRGVVPVLGVFAMSAVRLMPSLNRIIAGLAAIRYFHASIEAVERDLQEVAPAPLHPTSAPRLEQTTREPGQRGLSFLDAIEVRHVSYHYPAAHKPALYDISLRIPKGHSVAFVGPSGAGKSTLVDVILGLLIPTEGQVLVDGLSIQEQRDSWQGLIGYVPQSVYLLDDTIRRNVAFGVADELIDDRQVWQALGIAQLASLVQSLPEQLATRVGEHGVRFSGGQRQRLGIARAVYHNPTVLILDEATSAVDAETESAIIGALAAPRSELTTVTITHRLPMLQHCDTIFVLKDGRLIGAGPYHVLLATQSEFQQMVLALESSPNPTAPVSQDQIL